MKQVYLLDKDDLAALRAGQPFEIHVAGQVIILRAEPNGGPRGGAVTRIDPDLRAKAIKMLKAGKSSTEIGRKLGLNPSSVYNWKDRRKSS